MALAREPPRLGDKFEAASIIYREAFDRSKTPKLENKTFYNKGLNTTKSPSSTI